MWILMDMALIVIVSGLKGQCHQINNKSPHPQQDWRQLEGNCYLNSFEKAYSQ